MLNCICMKKACFLLCAAWALCACGGYAETDVTLPDGFVIRARVADTPQKTEKGLMFVKRLPETEGMLFVFEQEQEHYFWMKNTLIDLDIIFLSPEKKITRLYERVPHTYTYTPEHEIPVVRGRGLYVLEAAAGTISRRGLKTGDEVSFTLTK